MFVYQFLFMKTRRYMMKMLSDKYGQSNLFQSTEGNRNLAFFVLKMSERLLPWGSGPEAFLSWARSQSPPCRHCLAQGSHPLWSLFLLLYTHHPLCWYCLTNNIFFYFKTINLPSVIFVQTWSCPRKGSSTKNSITKLFYEKVVFP